jgi:hypothetical protein
MIQSTSNYLGFNRADAIANAAKKTAPAITPPLIENTDHFSRVNSEALQTALAKTPEIRPDVVARGQRLLVDMNYPPRAIIEGLAKLFANSEDPSEQA